MDGKFIALKGAVAVSFFLIKTGVASSTVKVLSSDSFHSDIISSDFPSEVQYEQQTLSKSVGNFFKNDTRNLPAQTLKGKSFLSGGATPLPERDFSKKDVVEEQNQIDLLEEYFNEMEEDEDGAISFQDVKNRSFTSINDDSCAFLDEVVEALWEVKHRVMYDLMDAKRRKNGDQERHFQSALEALMSLVTSYQNSVSSFLNNRFKKISIRLEIELERLNKTLKTLTKEISCYCE